MLAVTQRIDDDRDLVAGIQTSWLPPLAHQFDRSAHLNAPLDGRGLRIVRIGHEDLDPAVRVGPLKLFHCPDERNLSRLIEHRARMVSKCGARHQGGADTRDGGEGSVSADPHSSLVGRFVSIYPWAESVDSLVRCVNWSAARQETN